MVRFLRQLGLLLWKNWKLKTSLPWGLLSTLVELFWPVGLFLIIGVLRLLFPAEHQADAVYRPKALPSAGLLPFMQTIVCDLDDKDILLNNSLNTSFPDMFPGAKVNELYKDLDKFVQSNFEVDKLCESVEVLKDVADLLEPQGEVTVGSLLRNSTEFTDFLEHEYGISPQLAKELVNANINYNKVPAVISPVAATLNPFSLLSASTLKQLVCNSTLLGTVIELKQESADILRRDLCNTSNGSSQDFSALAKELQQNLDLSALQSINNPLSGTDPIKATQEILKLVQLGRASEQLQEGFGNGSDNTTFEEFFCGKGVSIRAFSAFVVNLLTRNKELDDRFHKDKKESFKELLPTPENPFSPKILFSPGNSTKVKEIIKKANRTLSTIGTIRDICISELKCSKSVMQAIPPNGRRANALDSLMKYLILGIGTPSLGGIPLDNIPGFSDMVHSVVANLTLAEKVELAYLFDVQYQNNIWRILLSLDLYAKQVLTYVNSVDWNFFYPMETESDLIDLAFDFEKQKELGMDYILAGVVFDGVSSQNEEEPIKDLSIRIRMNTTYVHETDVIRNKIWYPSPERNLWKRRYLDAGFIFIQDMIERGAIEVLSGKNITSPGVYVQELPYPCYNRDKFLEGIQIMLPIALTLAWLFSVAMTVRGVVKEKELRLKEVMKMMGMSGLVHWVSWFLTSLVIFSVSVLVMVCTIYAFGIYTSSNFFIVWIYLEIYAIATILLCFVMSLMFNNANLSASVSGLLYFMTIFISVTVWLKQREMHPILVALTSLIAPVGFGIGAAYMTEYELQTFGIQFANINDSPVQEDHFSFFLAMLMLVVDTLLYALLVWYIDAVFPGQYGTPKPWYFPMELKYWVGKSRAQRIKTFFTSRKTSTRLSVSAEDGEITDDEAPLQLTRPGVTSDTEGDYDEDNDEAYEEEPTHLSVGIEIKKLVKVYSNVCKRKKKQVVAINNLSLNLYEDQITAFLGHNGAGKTTTMSILMGLFEPTSGTASINGLDIKKDMDEIRKSLGICPQHNVLFDRLTVRDHVMFFAYLKGRTWKEAKEETKEWLDKVDMTEFSSRKACHLSGGMKRKLSILLAFVGDSRSIILDEPTSGVDPYARRQIWDFISKSRKGRTIMLATHHMDEAEILGDRIAIISKGELLCCGSYFFLRNRFGKGHQLVIATQPPSNDTHVEETDGSVSQLTDFLSDQIPGSRLVEVAGTDLKYLLPLSNTGPHTLASLFDELDKQVEGLRIESYGFTACSLEEVFVRVTYANGDLDELGDNYTLNDYTDIVHEKTKNGSVNLETENGFAVQSSEVPHVSEENGIAEQQVPISDDEDENGSEYVDEGVPLFSETLPVVKKRQNVILKWIRTVLVQLVCLLQKRLQYSYHRYLLVSMQNFLPLSIVLLCLIIAKYLLAVPDPIAFEFTLQQYTKTGFDNYMIAGGPKTEESCQYFNQLYRPCGIGPSLLQSSRDPSSPCFWPNWNTSTCSSALPDEYLVTCGGENAKLVPKDCDLEIRNTLAPKPENPKCFKPFLEEHMQTYIQDLRYGSNDSYPSEDVNLIVDYILWSNKLYIEDRYGGVGFGLKRSDINPKVDNVYKNTSKPYLALNKAAKAYFSYKGYHSMPTFLNILNNVILRKNLPDNVDTSTYGIKTHSHPYETTTLQKLEKALESGSFLVNPLGLMFALGFLVCGYCVILIEERSHKFLHLQEVSGLSKSAYWISSYIWDYSSYAMFVIITLLLFMAFQDPNFTPPDVFIAFSFTLFIFGMSLIPWVYFLSLAFNSSTTAFIILFCGNFFGGFALLIIDAVVYIITNEEGNGKYFLLVPMPTYALGRAFSYLSFHRVEESLRASLDPTAEVVPVFEALKYYLIAMVVYAVIGWVLLVLFDYFIPKVIIPTLCNTCVRSSASSLPTLDDDVAKERERIIEGRTDDDVLTTFKLTKYYRNITDCFKRLRPAVDELCFGVRKGECFGLLGVNGAGKTSTFKMLTGDLRPTNGSAKISGQDLMLKWFEPSRKHIGYCPQFEGLLDHLTGRQHLNLFARLRGFRGNALKTAVSDVLEKLHLMQYADRLVGAYSGGNRRKLSTAIALLTQPQILLLDEPTAGVDPEARRFLWDVIQRVTKEGQSVLLTTHSMAECEVLCSKVAIMVNGSLKCLGSPQHLREKFGCGYHIKLHMKPSITSLNPVMELIRQNFEGAVLKESHHNVLVYQWVPGPGGLGHLHRVLQDVKDELDIANFSVFQTNLDDVFIHFAKQQGENLDVVSSNPVADSLPDIVSSAAVTLSALERITSET